MCVGVAGGSEYLSENVENLKEGTEDGSGERSDDEARSAPTSRIVNGE